MGTEPQDGEAPANGSFGSAAAGGNDNRIERLRKAKEKLQGAIDSTNDNEAQSLLHECISLISDACVMNHGFGAALKAKYKSG